MVGRFRGHSEAADEELAEYFIGWVSGTHINICLAQLPLSHPENRLHLGVSVEHHFSVQNLTIYSNKTFRQIVNHYLNLTTITLKRIKTSSMFYHVYLLIIQLVDCYNIETEPYKIFELPKSSNADLFGFSFDSNRKNIWIGAPKSRDPEGTGAVFECNLGDGQECKELTGIATENTKIGFHH